MSSGKSQPKAGNHEWTRIHTNLEKLDVNGHKKA